MHTISVYPERNPSLEEIKGFVRSFPDGDWVTGSRGVIEADDGRVYLDYDEQYRKYFDQDLDEQQRAELTGRLGFSPRLAIHLQVSNAYQHSRELARAVCEALVRRWGGGWSNGASPASETADVEPPAAEAARDVPATWIEKKPE
jgi:hypothetical protein